MSLIASIDAIISLLLTSIEKLIFHRDESPFRDTCL